MTVETQTTPGATPTPAEFRPLDPVDAMLRGRYAQTPFLKWLKDRVINIYPK